jgi:hypothetical protein
MQAVSLGWSYPSAAGIAPVFMDETGAGALSRPARPEAWTNSARDSASSAAASSPART